MQINVRFLENLRLEASFDDFTVTTDQPVRYKGDGTAPSPFDYFLASSALCAAYFVRVYCAARDIPMDDIKLTQNNVIDPENRYAQTFKIDVDLPEDLSEKDRQGILRSIERCTVKKVIQQGPEFDVQMRTSLSEHAGLIEQYQTESDTKTMIIGKDAPLEETIANMTGVLATLGINIEIASWRNIVPNVWSVHIRDADSPMCFTNGKGATKDAALCSALGEYMERISCNYFYNDYFLGDTLARNGFAHYPDERWFSPDVDDGLPAGLLDEHMRRLYDPDGELRATHLVDTNSGASERGICALPFVRQSDQETVYIPAGLIGNLFVSNGMSAGNTLMEARVQCLSEIFERAVKKQIIEGEIALPCVPRREWERFPKIAAGIDALEKKGFPILVKDASLGGRYPVACVTLMNPKTGGVFASFGAHPKFEVALERSLTELLQGRSFEGLNVVPPPTFSSLAVTEPNNFVEHFIDSTGVVSWKFFSSKSDYTYTPWNIAGTTEEECRYLLGILRAMEKEVYIADYEDFGTKACRILVPGYSEIYPVEDLIWDNTNKALSFRSDILSLHSLGDAELTALVERLEDSELDHYLKISDLIGIAFDENTVWGQLDVGELKGLIYLALGRFPEAKEITDMFLTFNDNSTERRLFYQALQAMLDVTMDEDLARADYVDNLTRMFGDTVMEAVLGSIDGRVKFYGLTPTDTQLTGLEKHQKLLESYEKLQRFRASKHRNCH